MNFRLFAAILFGLATPAAAASGGGHGAHSFTMPVRPFAIETAAQSAHESQHFAGLGASGAYTTLLSGTFPTAPYEGGVVVPSPYPPYYLVQYVPPPPPPRCVRPLLIHLVPAHTSKNLPHLVYGTPFDCPG
jgi:hypothetical protein